MELWIFTFTLLFLQDVAQPIRVHDSSSKFLIVANSQDQKDESLGTQNDLQYHKFDSNRSHPRIKNEKKNKVSVPTLPSSNLLGFEKTEEKSRKGSGNLLSPSVEITPASSQYLGYTSGSHLQDTPLFGESPMKTLLKNDQHFVRSPIEKQPPLKHTSKKYTNVKLPTFEKQTPFEPSTHFEDINLKLSKVESTIHRPKTSDRLNSEKPIHEYFSSDINNLIEKAKNMDHKAQLGSPRKHRNSEDDLGHRSDKYEDDGYLDHGPSVESIGEYHVYHEAPEKKKKKEIHYHQHKHLHDHDHDQKHSHKHQSGHHHDHGHDHRQKHAHVHGHDSSHWHVQHEKDVHHHHSHHDHDHHSSHDHKHHGEHSHRHASDHHHGHDDHHDHHEDHKNWHSHKHHSDHDHKHGHDHKHKGKHGHDHSHGHKHKHSHNEKHAKH